MPREHVPNQVGWLAFAPIPTRDLADIILEFAGHSRQGNVFFVRLHLFVKKKRGAPKRRGEEKKNKQNSLQMFRDEITAGSAWWYIGRLFGRALWDSALFSSSSSFLGAPIFPDDEEDDEGKVDSSWNSLLTLCWSRFRYESPPCLFLPHLDSIQRS